MIFDPLHLANSFNLDSFLGERQHFRMKFSSICISSLLAITAAGIFAPASAQQRSPNFGKSALLHEWPISGSWQAALARMVPSRKLGCIAMTGYHNFSSGERYLWGLRQRGKHIAIEIIDNNPIAISGPAIKVIVDGAVVGDFPITRRVDSVFHVVRSDLSPKDGAILERLMSVGGNIKFVTDNATYSASLGGAKTVMQDFHACSIEANQINSAQAP